MLKKAGKIASCLALISILLSSFVLPKDEAQADNSTAALPYKYKLLKDNMGTGMKLYYNNGVFYYKSQLNGGLNIANQSTDLKTWTRIIDSNTFGSSKRFDLHSLSFIGGRVYATGHTVSTTTFPNYTTTSFLGYMNDTSNTSSSWTQSSFPSGFLLLGPIVTDGSNYVMGAGNDNVIYRQASSSGGIQEKAWTTSKNMTSGSRYENAVYDEVNNRLILADDANNIVYSKDDGINWNKIVVDSSSSAAITDLVQTGGTTYISGRDGVWKLVGTIASRLLPSGSNYNAVAVDEHNNVYALRSDGTVLMSSNTGATWSPIVAKGSDNTSTYFGAMEYGDGKLLVGTDKGLYQVVTNSVITKQPQDAQVNVDTSAAFSVNASGNDLAYQWQVDMTGTGSSFTNIAGATSTSLTIHAGSKDMNGYLYRVIITDASGEQMISEKATLSVNIPKVKVSYLSGEHGTISVASEDVEAGTKPVAVPIVTPDNGYRFMGWSSDGGITKLSSDQLKAKVITGPITYTAYYVQLIKGDLDGTGGVSSADAQLLVKYLKGTITLGPDQLKAADFNNDGVVDEADVKAILAFVTGKG
ncbi:dockerin type I domain-containing protein [Paenibacillus sp. BAC0078]